jgi:hypothetical protein
LPEYTGEEKLTEEPGPSIPKIPMYLLVDESAIEDQQKMLVAITKARQAHIKKVGHDERSHRNEVYQLEFHNLIFTVEDIYAFINHVMKDVEHVKYPVKVSFDFGYITEERTLFREKAKTKYSFRPPDFEKSFVEGRPTILKDSSEIPRLVNVIQERIIQNTQDVSLNDSATRFIGIYGMVLCVYNLSKAGIRVPWLEEHIKKDTVRWIDSKNMKLCMFTALACFKLLNRPGGKVSKCMCCAEANRLFYTFYEALYPNWKATLYKTHAFQQPLLDYGGFDFATEMTRFNDVFKLSTNVYGFDTASHKYSLVHSYATEHQDLFNILVITHHEDTHILYISDVQKLTGMLICPICHMYARPTYDAGHHRSQ